MRDLMVPTLISSIWAIAWKAKVNLQSWHARQLMFGNDIIEKRALEKHSEAVSGSREQSNIGMEFDSK